jgi:hypothetical protein
MLPQGEIMMQGAIRLSGADRKVKDKCQGETNINKSEIKYGKDYSKVIFATTEDEARC